jgi:UDP-N-acetylglucosamine 2-epimerase
LQDAKVVLTDSGGHQEETTALGVPCITLRANTERPAAVDIGTNTLVGTILSLYYQMFKMYYLEITKQAVSPTSGMEGQVNGFVRFLRNSKRNNVKNIGMTYGKNAYRK